MQDLFLKDSKFELNHPLFQCATDVYELLTLKTQNIISAKSLQDVEDVQRKDF